MTGTRRATISEVAERAGVSQTTVSHVLSGNRPVADDTRNRVERVIGELGYRPNSLARSLRIQKSNTIAVILPDITNPFYPMMARGIDDSFGEEYRTLICNTDANRDRELAYAIDAFDRNADGIVIVAFQIHAGDLEGILSRGMSVVSMGEAIDDPRVDMVLKEDERGAFEATSYLLRKGHTRVGFIGGVDGPGPDRRHGYRRALKEAGLSVFPELTATGEWNRTSGSAAMRQLLSLEAPPTAVFCANDLMAIGAIDAARELRVEVPDDLAVVGFDDIEAAAMITPRLTTFANPAYESGQAAGRLLLDRIGAPEALERRTVVLHSELIERDSA